MNDPAKASLEALAHAGIAALQRGDAAAARQAFDKIIVSGRATPQIWLLLAQSCQLLGDHEAARAALAPVHAADAGNPYALVMQGEMHAADEDDSAAVVWFDRALGAAAGLAGLPADLVARLDAATVLRTTLVGRFRTAMSAALVDAGIDEAGAGERFAESLAIVAGQTRPHLQEPTSFYFPGLPQRAFYDPADFPWATALAAAAPAITAEAAAVLADRAGMAPYVQRPADRPAKPHSLMDDPRWSAFHLMQNGQPVSANAARCPATMAAIRDLPIPVISGRSPMVLFSVLAPGTHIQPHHGMLNTRLICHLPLIVPPDCRLRVGNSIRNVRGGEVLIFDDSIEHEAWNDSDQMRAILLFEIWRPDLTAAERRALTVMFESVSRYASED